MKKHYLFSPGPVTVSSRVKKALVHDDICHRGPQFESLFNSIQEDLLKVYKADGRYVCLLITGSGTAANEAVISTYVGKQDKTLLVKNGNFGDFLHNILIRYKFNFDLLEYQWGEFPRIKEIEEKLLSSPEIKNIIMVFHETSTSMINPIKEVGRVSSQLGKTFIVDGVSAVGGEDVNVVRDHIDFCTTSSNKCLSSLPGVGIICARREKLEELKGRAFPNEYLDLYKMYEFAEKIVTNTSHPFDYSVFRFKRSSL